MYNFENRVIDLGLDFPIRYSRIIASFLKAGGNIDPSVNGEFTKWLESLGLPFDDIENIVAMACVGVTNLTDNAITFLENRQHKGKHIRKGP